MPIKKENLDQLRKKKNSHESTSPTTTILSSSNQGSIVIYAPYPLNLIQWRPEVWLYP